MNIIFHRYYSICEPDYIDAFRFLGIDVIEDCSTGNGEAQDISHRVEQIGRLVLENSPIFVFSINFFPYISIVCEKLNVKYVCVSVDCPVLEIYNVTIRNRCNRLFLFDHEQYLSVVDENPECIFHLPLGASADRIDRTIGEYTTESPHVYSYDVSFVGSLYNEKDPYQSLNLIPHDRGYLDGLMSAQTLFDGVSLIEELIDGKAIDAIKQADPSFHPSDLSIRNIDRQVVVDNYLSYHMSYLDRVCLISAVADGIDAGHKLHLFTLSNTECLRGCEEDGKLIVHGGVNSLEEMPRVFRMSRININHTMRAIRCGLPQRIWDILGSGGFLLTNAQAEIPEYLVPGEHLEVYSDFREMTEKINYYLVHEDERERIAYSGYKEVKARHQVLHRVMEMIRMI